MSFFNPVRTWGPFPSSSGGKPYTVQLNKNGVISCNCMGWAAYTEKKKLKGPRSCKHTEQVIRTEGLQVQANGQYFWIVDKKVAAAAQKFANANAKKGTPQERFAQFLEEWRQAMVFMGSMDIKDPRIMDAAAAVEMAKFKVDAYMAKLEDLGIDGTAQWDAVNVSLGRA